MKIRLLDASVANKIAAGEVVERPASIVKELVENSIDAGATSVTVEIKGGGIDLIRITDNGCGMVEDDVKNAFLRHATSKIFAAEDLNDILTLGFRGEALASIAAVSCVELSTRTKDTEEGTFISLEGGNILHFYPFGCPEGTTITVKNLFFNTPARRKFLKRPSQEAVYVADVINKLALSNPQLSIRFISEGKTLLRSPGDNNLLSSIRAVFGNDVSSNMIYVSDSRAGITVTGYIGKRELQRGNRSRQFLFINGRCVKNDTVAAAVNQAYSGRLNVGKFPFYVLQLSLSGSLVDVNVHPTKQEVRFADGLDVFGAVFSVISKALRENQEIPSLFKEEINAPESTVVSTDKINPLLDEAPVDFDRLSKSQVSDGTASAQQKTSKQIINEDFIIASRATENMRGKSLGSAFENQFGTIPASVKEDKKEAPNAKGQPAGNLIDDSLKATPAKLVKEIQSFADFSSATCVRDSARSPLEYLDQDLDFSKNQGAEQSTLAQGTKAEYMQGASEQGTKVEQNTLMHGAKTEQNVLEQSLFSEDFTKELSQGPQYKICGTLFDTYIIIEDGDDCYIIDQHAAHERLLFERLYASMASGGEKQMLLFPQIIKLSPKEEVFLSDCLEQLTEMGFEIEEMGFGSFAVKATPLALDNIDAEKFITSLLSEESSVKILRTNELKRQKLMRLACRCAVKGGDKLSTDQIKSLISLIRQEGVPLSCPHGRPILVRLSKHELEVRFKRIQ